MTLRQKQSEFARLVAILIFKITCGGYEVTFGDAARLDRRGHHPNSKHYCRLAIDLNLFRNGRYLRTTKAHQRFGEFFERIGGGWGGRFTRKDGNHYEWSDANYEKVRKKCNQNK